VQNLYELDQYSHSRADRGLGQLTLTIGKFYRVNGGSTQHRGVIPDIVLPSAIDAVTIGESSRDRALPWDQIAATRFQTSQPLDAAIAALTRYENKELAGDPDMRHLEDSIAEIDELRSRKQISLNLVERKKEREREQRRNSSVKTPGERRRGLPALESLDKLKPDEQPDVLLQTAARVASEYSRISSCQSGPAHPVSAARFGALRPSVQQHRVDLPILVAEHVDWQAAIIGGYRIVPVDRSTGISAHEAAMGTVSASRRYSTCLRSTQPAPAPAAADHRAHRAAAGLWPPADPSGDRSADHRNARR
jgi:hypothetical protein